MDTSDVDKDNSTEKLTEQDSSSLIALLNSMKASIDSGNTLLQELVTQKQPSPDHETDETETPGYCQCASQRAMRAICASHPNF